MVPDECCIVNRKDAPPGPGAVAARSQNYQGVSPKSIIKTQIALHRKTCRLGG